MISVCYRFSETLRCWFDPNYWIIRLLKLPRSNTRRGRPGLIMIQIDGLSHTHLHLAMAKGQLPFIKELIEKKRYFAMHHYSGVPSSTPPIQAELFYGKRQYVPAFKYKDHLKQKIFTFYDSEAAALVESRIKSEGAQGLLERGSSYSNIFRGGAPNAHFCVASIGWTSFVNAAMRPSVLAVLILFNLLHLIRIFLYLTIEILLALADSIHGSLMGFGLKEEFKFICSRLVAIIALREVSILGVKLDMTRGLPVIHVNFFGYDDQAHRRGPGSKFAYWALRGIDDSVRSIWNAAQNALSRDYDVWIYSDHGQEQVVPYVSEYGQSIDKGIDAVWRAAFTDEKWRIETHHNHGQSKYEMDAGTVVVTAQGPIGYIYAHRMLFDEEKKRVAQALVQQAKIPLVLTIYQGDVTAFTEEGMFSMASDAEAILGSNHPYLEEAGRELASLAFHPDAGDFVISGWRKSSPSVSFPCEYGSHAGPGSHETDGFALFPAHVRSLDAKKFIRPELMRKAALQFLRGDPKLSSGKDILHRRRSTLRVMTYNVHSCKGMDGKRSPERIARVIAREDPDVVALQELDVGKTRSGKINQVEMIARLLDMNYHFHPVLLVEEEKYGNAILSKYPIKLIKVGELPRCCRELYQEPRGVLWAEIEYQHRAIQLLNTHLSFWRREQNQQAEDLCGQKWLGEARTKGEVILCGDFNAAENSYCCRLISGQLKDVQKALPDHKPLHTWFGHFPMGRIDHIFVSSDVRVKRIEVARSRLEKIASDHLPLLAELEFADSPLKGHGDHHHSQGLTRIYN